MFWPILYTVLTTICAFLSLVFSEIKPIIDFGWMMTLGLVTSFIITFTLLPTLLNFISENKVELKDQKDSKVTSILGDIAINKKKIIFSTTVVIIFLSLFGITRLEVENSFINYFNKKTEIYKGMKLIDDKLGGTTPLDVIVKFGETEKSNDNDEDDFDDWGDDDQNVEKYWFTRDKIDKIDKIHDYLDSIPEIGKVLSVASGVKLARQINDGEDLNDLELALLRSVLPEDIRETLLYSYINKDDSVVRISTRVNESASSLNRDVLLKKINNVYLL